MNQLQIFDNPEFGQVRMIEVEGQPYFIGKDVAEILGYQNTRDALLSHVDDEDKNTVAIYDGIPGNPNKVLINESGLYSLILSSKLPTAKKFKRWVTSEVLPSIRKTGSYSTSNELTIEQRIRVMEIISRSFKHSLPHVLDVAKPFLADVVIHDGSQQADNSSILKFLNETNVLGMLTNEVYDRYLDFCKTEQLKPTNNINFSRQVTKILDIKIVDKKLNGQKFRLFISK